ncbi:hypothetical protein C5E45_24450 [Nocardia nova]|uniref:DUF3558 domain-containing protein n=2 Tax=Nocardia nova TaxID=37330 RepID=A0A2S6AKD8_9NOCA|nr:hypothetical protein C5E45_24450 [Nocardia nova]
MVRGMRGIGPFAAALIATICVTAGCSSHTQQNAAVRPVDDPNLLAGCGPLSDSVIAATLRVPAVESEGGGWRATYPGAGTAELTYAWLRGDTLARDVDVANQQGYRVEKIVIKRFGGMYWRTPRDPGSCAVTVADTGTVTWWVNNRDHTDRPDPCAAAMNLMQATLSVDGV